jgi:cytidyltransferase-like protein
MDNTGVIIARMQPIHNGHMALIKKAAKECHNVLILLGSANKFNERNPIPIGLRKTLVEDAVRREGLQNVKVVALNDLTDESDNSHDWGFYLYHAMIQNNPERYIRHFTIYYSDGFEIITKWFPPFMLKDTISLVLMARGSIENGISATKVREYILSGDTEKLKDCVPSNVLELCDALKSQIEFAKTIGV